MKATTDFQKLYAEYTTGWYRHNYHNHRIDFRTKRRSIAVGAANYSAEGS